MNNLKQFVKNYFTKGHQRTIEAKKNILFSFIIKGVSILISLILVPLTINYVNPTQYGIWLTLSSILAWLSFFDIGFGNGLRNKFTEAKVSGDFEKARIYISTTYASLFLIFSIVWILFNILNYFLNWSHLLNTTQEMARELSVLALVVFSCFCMQIVLKTINTILIADQKPAKAAFCDMLGQLIALSAIFILTKTTAGTLLHLGLILSIAPVLILIGSSIWFYKKQYRDFKPSLKFVQFNHAREILNLGIKFFIIQIAVIIIYQTSNIIIAQTCGPKDVTIYNIALKYFSIATMIFGVIMAPIWSAFTDAYVQNDYLWMRSIIIKLKKILYLLFAGVCIMLAISQYVYKLWIGDLIDIRISISLIIALYVVINLWNMLHSQLLNGLGKIKLQLYISLIGIVINIPMSIILGQKFGIEGVILSSIILSIISAVYAPIQVSLLLKRKASGIWNR